MLLSTLKIYRNTLFGLKIIFILKTLKISDNKKYLINNIIMKKFDGIGIALGSNYVVHDGISNGGPKIGCLMDD